MFKAAWEEIWTHSIRRHLPGIVAAQVAKALDGDTPAARLLADLAGVLTTRMDAKVHHTGKMEVETQQHASVVQRILGKMPPETRDAFIDALWPVEGEANATTAGDSP